MKTRLFLIATLLMAFCSCITKKSQEEVSIQSLTHEVLMDGITGEFDLMNDSIAVVIDHESDSAFWILNLSQMKVNKLGRIGEGLDDFLLPSSMKGNSFSIYDMNKERFFTFFLNEEDYSWKLERFFNSDSLTHLYIHPILNNRYVATGFYENCQLMLLDEKGTIIKRIDELPYRDEVEKKVSGEVRSEVYQGTLAVSPSKKKVVFATLYGDMIYFYDVLSNGELALKFKQENAYAEYDYEDFLYGMHYVFSPYYFMDVCLTDDYVYALYSGKQRDDELEACQSNLIRVYDWDGTLVKKLQLDIDVKQIAVTKDNRKVYAIADLPDPVLVIFKL